MDANDGKVCVVIGGARGIGKAGVKALVENGIKVPVLLMHLYLINMMCEMIDR